MSKEHLEFLRSLGGRLEKERAKKGISRAGGQELPKSKYMPNVPRQVRADGGKTERENNLKKFNPILDEVGNPKVFYHGTMRRYFGNEITGEPVYKDTPDIKVFDTSSQMGSHFGTKKQSNERVFVGYDASDKGQIYPVHLNIKNPIRFQDKKSFNPKNIFYQLQNNGISETASQKIKLSGISQESIKEYLKKKGHDGIVYLNRFEGLNDYGNRPRPETLHHLSDEEFKKIYPEAEDSYIAFEPQQIKSATGNRGTFDPNDPDITKSEGGEVHPHIAFLRSLNGYAPGGSVEDQQPSIGHNNPPEDFEHPESYRELNAFGLYSKAAEVAQDATGQNVMQTPDQWEKYLLARGVKPDEIKWSSFRDSFDDRNRKYHKDEIASQFNYDNQVPYEEKLYKNEKGFPNTGYEEYNMEGPHENYRELVLQHNPDNNKYYSSHWAGDSNPLLHIRMNDKIIGLAPDQVKDIESRIAQATDAPVISWGGGMADFAAKDGLITPEEAASYARHRGWKSSQHFDKKGLEKKLLHIEEMQSDWGQKGRQAGFNEEDKKSIHKKWKDANKALSDFDFAIRNKYRQQYEKAGIDPNSIERMIDNSTLSYLLRKDGTPEEREQYSKLSSDERKHYSNLSDPIVEEGPHIGDTNKWVDLGLKRILKEAADGGYDGITFAPGDVQVARWNDKGLKKPYDETIPSRMQKLLTKIDPQLKFGSYAFDLPIWKDEQSGAVATNSVHYVPLNANHHSEIQKGFERMRRGGSVVQNELDPAKEYEKETGKVHPNLKFTEQVPGTKERMSKMRADVPVRWSSSPDHATAHLAYITDAEAELLKKADLHNSNIANEHHVGPGGVPSYQGGGIGSGGGSYSANGGQDSPSESGPGPGVTSGGGGSSSSSSSSGSSSTSGGGGGSSSTSGGGGGSPTMPNLGSGIGAPAAAAPEQDSQDLGNEEASPTGPFGFGIGTDVGNALVANVLGGGNAQAIAPAGISNMAGAPTDPGYTDIGITAMRAPGSTSQNLSKLQSLDPSYGTKAATLVNRAMDVGMNPTITSAARTLEQQLAINQNPNQIYPSAAPGSSMHNYGLAIDLGGLTPSQQAQLGKMAEEEGIVWGGAEDPVHYGLAKEGMTAAQKAASLGAGLYTGATDVAKELLGIKPAAASDLSYPERTRGITSPASSNFNVPNAGDLYGATNAPLAVEGPSTTPLSDQMARSEAGMIARQGSVPGMSSEALEWNKAQTDALNKMYGNPNEKGLNELSNSLLKAVREAPETASQLEQLGAAINLPFGIGSYIGSQYGVQPATEQQQADIANVLNQANMPQTVPSNFATEAGLESRYGLPPEENLQRAGSMGSLPPSAFVDETGNVPLPPERPSEFTTMTPSTGRQNYEPSTPQRTGSDSSSKQQSARSSFEKAFAEARAQGLTVFPWRNPITGQVSLYTTELKATGGPVKSSVSKNAKLLHSSPAVEIALSKVSSLPLDAVKMIKNGTRGRS